jgi:hypothetical protein
LGRCAVLRLPAPYASRRGGGGTRPHAHTLVRPGGWLLTWEPCHDRFTERDAAVVALIRSLLSVTGHWYDPAETAGRLGDEEAMAAYVRDVWMEYVFERDPSELGGQSPNDLAADGAAILEALRGNFQEIAFFPAIPTSTACSAVFAEIRRWSGV